MTSIAELTPLVGSTHIHRAKSWHVEQTAAEVFAAAKAAKAQGEFPWDWVVAVGEINPDGEFGGARRPSETDEDWEAACAAAAEANEDGVIAAAVGIENKRVGPHLITIGQHPARHRGKSLAEVLADIADHGDFCEIAHIWDQAAPWKDDHPTTTNALRAVMAASVNDTPGWRSAFWDLLAQDHRVAATGNTDAKDLHMDPGGSGWVTVAWAERLTMPDILAAIRAGRTCATCDVNAYAWIEVKTAHAHSGEVQMGGELHVPAGAGLSLWVHVNGQFDVMELMIDGQQQERTLLAEYDNISTYRIGTARPGRQLINARLWRECEGQPVCVTSPVEIVGVV